MIVDKQIKCLLLLIVLASSHGVSAVAPDSIGGKVYRHTYIRVGTRASSEVTIVFGTDGRFTSLKNSNGYALVLQAPYTTFLNTPRSDGTFQFARTDDSTASINLRFDDGSTKTMGLSFTSATGGVGYDNGGIPDSPIASPLLGQESQPPSYTFSLSDMAVAQAGPTANVSMRGHVSEGTGLIVGFVVPGAPPDSDFNVRSPPPGFPFREVLIRVVGPSLTQFGVTGVWVDPNFQLYRGNSQVIVNQILYPDWSVTTFGAVNGNPPQNSSTVSAFRKIFSYVGAFQLTAGSKDAAAVVRLPPGAYTIVANAGEGDSGGEALVEVYFLP